MSVHKVIEIGGEKVFVESDGEKIIVYRPEPEVGDGAILPGYNAPVDALDPPKKRKYTRHAKKPAGGVRPGRGGGVRHCKNCGKPGHLAKTCPDDLKHVEPPAKDASEAIDQIRYNPITPDQLLTIKRMLRDKESYEAIEAETGISVLKIGNIAKQLGLL